MAAEYSILRSHLLDFFRSRISSRDTQLGIESLRRYFSSKGINLDEDEISWPIVQQIIHELYIEGIINPGPRLLPNFESVSKLFEFPFYHVTEYGERVLENTEYQPYDPDGYLGKIQADIPTIDLVIIRYLEECLACFRRNLLLSAAVTLGCAAEKAILLLINVFGNSITDPNDKANFEKETSTFIISRKYKALWSRLEPIANTLPDNLGDNLGNILDRIFDIIRTTRNEAGHPSGNIIEKETVHANLLLFPIFCRRIYQLLNHFSQP